MMLFKKLVTGYGSYLYSIARIIVGLLFAQHGFMKVFGYFGGTAFDPFTLLWYVGVLELVGGLAIAFGVFTRLAALGSAVLMLIAYFRAHAPQGLVPVQNGGELAVLYFAAFVIIFVYGSQRLGLEKAAFKNELF